MRCVPVAIVVCGVCFTVCAQETTLRATARLVIAPTTVTNRQGQFVDGLRASDFLLYQDGRPQRIDVDLTYVPISLVVTVESGDNSAAALNKIRKIGSLIEPLIVGERGQVAVVAYGDQIRTVQDFTSEFDKVERALHWLQPSGPAPMIDAVIESVRLLARQPANRRRVLLLIGEARDRGSRAKVEDAVTLAQEQNVVIYTLTYSPYATPFTAKAGTIPPPNSAGINLIAIAQEIARLGKRNAGDAFANYTGGAHLGFLKQNGLEKAMARIGEELHSQYLLSFAPPPDPEAGFHSIEVRVAGRPELMVRTRPGYWGVEP